MFPKEKFLNDNQTRFNLLVTTTLASIVSPVTRTLFKIHDQNDPAKANDPQPRRHSCKGKPVRPDQEKRQYTFQDVLFAANRALAQLWVSLKLGLSGFQLGKGRISNGGIFIWMMSANDIGDTACY